MRPRTKKKNPKQKQLYATLESYKQLKNYAKNAVFCI